MATLSVKARPAAMRFFAGLILLRIGAGAALLWLRVHPADWSPFAFYGLRGLCWVLLAVSLTRRFLVAEGRRWWRFW